MAEAKKSRLASVRQAFRSANKAIFSPIQKTVKTALLPAQKVMGGASKVLDIPFQFVPGYSENKERRELLEDRQDATFEQQSLIRQQRIDSYGSATKQAQLNIDIAQQRLDAHNREAALAGVRAEDAMGRVSRGRVELQRAELKLTNDITASQEVAATKAFRFNLDKLIQNSDDIPDDLKDMATPNTEVHEVFMNSSQGKFLQKAMQGMFSFQGMQENPDSPAHAAAYSNLVRNTGAEVIQLPNDKYAIRLSEDGEIMPFEDFDTKLSGEHLEMANEMIEYQVMNNHAAGRYLAGLSQEIAAHTGNIAEDNKKLRDFYEKSLTEREQDQVALIQSFEEVKNFSVGELDSGEGERKLIEFARLASQFKDVYGVNWMTTDGSVTIGNVMVTMDHGETAIRASEYIKSIEFPEVDGERVDGPIQKLQNYKNEQIAFREAKAAPKARPKVTIDADGTVKIIDLNKPLAPMVVIGKNEALIRFEAKTPEDAANVSADESFLSGRDGMDRVDEPSAKQKMQDFFIWESAGKPQYRLGDPNRYSSEDLSKAIRRRVGK